MLVRLGSASIPHQDFFVFWEGWWQGFGVGNERAWVLRALICLVGSMGLGVSMHSRRDAAASGPLAAWVPSLGGQLPPLEWGRFWVPCLWVPGVRLPQYYPHWDSLNYRGLWLVPLTFLHRTAVLGLRPGFSSISLPKVPSAWGMSMQQEILRTQPAEQGWSIPPNQGLLLGEGQPEGHNCHQV